MKKATRKVLWIVIDPYDGEIEGIHNTKRAARATARHDVRSGYSLDGVLTVARYELVSEEGIRLNPRS